MMLAKRLFVGDGTRKTRLHDERGNLISISRLARNGSRSFFGQLARHAFGYRPLRPWISYDATQRLERLLTPSSRMLEFGSGMSTGWYAQRVGQVVSIEDYRPWYEQVQAIFHEKRIENVRYMFAANKDEYLSKPVIEGGNGFDLIMIDGNYRDECVDVALGLLRPGGAIYFDNSDRGDDPRTGNTHRAIDTLRAKALESGGQITTFTDFAPAQFVVQQGLLLQFPS